jgi:hypothetical protein
MAVRLRPERPRVISRTKDKAGQSNAFLSLG